MRDHHQRRLDRQFRVLSRLSPTAHAVMAQGGGRLGAIVRVPLGVVLVIGGMLFFLPFLGLWMIPLGLMVLAVDLPLLRPAVSAGIIRLRRRWSLWRRDRRDGKARQDSTDGSQD